MIVTPQESFLTLDEAATALRVHPETVRELARAGHIGHKVGKEWGFTASGLATYCEKNRQERLCQASGSIAGKVTGTRTFGSVENELDALLGAATKRKPRKAPRDSSSSSPSPLRVVSERSTNA